MNDRFVFYVLITLFALYGIIRLVTPSDPLKRLAFSESWPEMVELTLKASTENGTLANPPLVERSKSKSGELFDAQGLNLRHLDDRFPYLGSLLGSKSLLALEKHVDQDTYTGITGIFELSNEEKPMYAVGLSDGSLQMIQFFDDKGKLVTTLDPPGMNFQAHKNYFLVLGKSHFFYTRISSIH